MKKLTFSEHIGEVQIFRPITEIEVELDRMFRVSATKIYPKCNFCSEEIESGTGFKSSQPTIISRTIYKINSERTIVGEVKLSFFNNYKINAYEIKPVIIDSQIKEEKYFSQICENCVKQLYKKISDYNLTLFEACELLNRSKKSISRYIRRGLLHPQEIKSQQGTLEYRFSKADLEAFKLQETQDKTRNEK